MCSVLAVDHPGVRPGRCAFLGIDDADRDGRIVDRGEDAVDHVPGRSQVHVAVLERGLLGGVVEPVLLDVRALCFKKVDRRCKLRFVERVGVCDAQLRPSVHQLNRRVGDVDGRVVNREPLRRVGVEHFLIPARLVFGRVLVPHQLVGAAAVRDAVVDAIKRVVRLVLQRRVDVGVVRHQVNVHRLDKACRASRLLASPDAEMTSY